MRSDLLAAALAAEGEDAAEVFVGDHDGRLDPGFLDVGDVAGIRHVGRVVKLVETTPLVFMMLVDDAGGGGDEVQVELAGEAFLDDLEVEEAEEAAAVAEAEGGRRLGLEVEAGVVEAELAEAVSEVLEIVGVDGEQAAPDDGDAGLEAGEGTGWRGCGRR